MTGLIANPTDIEDRTARALVAILNADAGVQAITGRTRRNLVAWGDVNDAELPVLAYQFIDGEEIGGAGDNRFLNYQITAIADGDGARSMTAALMERIELGITEPLLAAQGLDACPLRRRRRSVPMEGEASRGTNRADIDLTLWVTK